MTARSDSRQQARRNQPRDQYRDVGKAMRQSIDRALADPKLTRGQALVLLVVLRDVASWSRLGEATMRDEIARQAGVSEETVKRAMKRLHSLGAVIWEPSTTRGRPSHVRLPEAVAVTSKADLDEPAEAAPTGPTTGHPDGPATAPTTGHPNDPPYEKTNCEKNPGWWEANDNERLTADEQAIEDARIVACRSADELGCSPEQWRDSSAKHREEYVRGLAVRLRDGQDPLDLLDALVAVKAPRNGVDLWPNFLLGRLLRLPPVEARRRASA